MTARDNDQQRVVLIKPGDTLLIGNVGDLTPAISDMAMHALKLLGLDRVVLFAEDIDIAKVPRGDFDEGRLR